MRDSKSAGRSRKRETTLEPVAEKDLDTTIQTLQGDSSIRCMIIPGASSDAVCRECLAMHSKWLAIRSYILYHNSRKFSAELIVFRSNFELKEIVSNCREKLRLNVISWHFNDCQIMDSIFPRHRELLEVHHLKDGLNEEQQMRTENTMDLNKIKQVLNVTAFERMQRASRSSGPPRAPFTFSNTLEMLRAKETLCIYISVYPSTSWNCIGWILKNV